MRSLYESLLDDDDVVLKRANDRTLVFQVDEMLRSKKPYPELIKLLESKVAIYRVNNNKDLRKLIFDYIKLAGYNCSLNWIDTSKVENTSFIFYNSKFNGDISKWDVSKVKSLYATFFSSKFNGDISKWDVSKAENMSYMFCDSKFNGDISKWDVSRVEDMNSMFGKSKFNRDISKWDVSRVKYAADIFNRCPIKEEYKPKFKIVL